MKKLHPVLQEVVNLMQYIEREMIKTQDAKVSAKELEKGLRSSALGASQLKEVPMTPLMKNALVHYGDKKDDQWRLTVDMPQTKAEQVIVSNMKQLLLRFNGSSDQFNDQLPLDSVDHYNVQCYQNMKDNLRDVQPGQAKARMEMSKRFTTPTSNTVKDIINKIYSDVAFQKAILIVMDQIPSVRASDHIREINLPFMNKHSGVGFPFWFNDRTVSDDGRTYAEITMSIAEKLKESYSEWYKYNIATEYGRNQRGKGRLLIATSRILNLLLNMLEAVEIEAYKEKSPLFIGYRDDEQLKIALTEMLEDCNKYGLKCANEDYDSFDSTVGQGMQALIGAISIYKANGSRSKRIALMRSIFSMKSQLIDGLNNKLWKILGRVFSGFIDTNRGGGLGNAIQMTTERMKQDQNYSELCYKTKRYMMVMGDDNLSLYRPESVRETLIKGMKGDFGGILSEKKYEFGVTFLQYRLFRDPTSKELVMVYAWPRVVRSMLMKEEAKGLGPVGWTYAWYQQLWKLYEYTPAFTIAVNLLIPFDENKFFMDTPVAKLNEMLKREDSEAFAKLNTDSQKRRFVSTWDRLYDGDPSKVRFHENDSMLQKIQDKIKEVYDPYFYQKYNLSY